jgi:hypothetical protein
LLCFWQVHRDQKPFGLPNRLVTARKAHNFRWRLLEGEKLLLRTNFGGWRTPC